MALLARSGPRIAALAAGVAAIALTAASVGRDREGAAMLPSLWRGGLETGDLRQWDHT